jgi:hypothetical protein
MQRVRLATNSKVIEADQISTTTNIFLFDGPHEEKDQYDGVTVARLALDKSFILIVDDWNWRKVRLGTFRAIRDSHYLILASVEIRTTLDNSHARADWLERPCCRAQRPLLWKSCNHCLRKATQSCNISIVLRTRSISGCLIRPPTQDGHRWVSQKDSSGFCPSFGRCSFRDWGLRSM